MSREDETKAMNREDETTALGQNVPMAADQPAQRNHTFLACLNGRLKYRFQYRLHRYQLPCQTTRDMLQQGITVEKVVQMVDN